MADLIYRGGNPFLSFIILLRFFLSSSYLNSFFRHSAHLNSYSAKIPAYHQDLVSRRTHLHDTILNSVLRNIPSINLLPVSTRN
ncbi:hypothetical protein FB192DRAFT_1034791 [Mucor lusitanicus]|uniref:Uncharacterized protein n=1 Tax=Mucor circinelloides f. lusitanicus TaxID=29924 RepID=A0A8H4B7J3_MUCCL|nr:hypothetical protein FB192DRAFT_1034791 [Mucor lusitanicus]